MKIKIKRIDKTLPLPQYHTGGSVGFDLAANVDTTIQPKEIALIPTGLIIQTPPGYMLAIIARSSTPRKKGLTMPNAVGIIDQDYCGPEDELKIMVYNFTDQPVVVARGERIAQGLFIRVDIADWEEVDEISGSNRGGFGSTGK